jgi:hypothetical protein
VKDIAVVSFAVTRCVYVIAAFGMTYAFASIAWINRFVWLYARQGAAYWLYYAWFAVVIVSAFLLRYTRAAANRELFREVGFGLAAGSIASAVAGLGSNVNLIEVLSVTGTNLQSVPEVVTRVFLLPLLTCGWAFGATMAIFIWCLIARSKQRLIIAGVLILQIVVAAILLNPPGARLQHIQFGAKRTAVLIGR